VSYWTLCEWCRKRNAEPREETERRRKLGGFGPFGEDAVCPECQEAYWRGRQEQERAYSAGRAMFEGGQP